MADVVFVVPSFRGYISENFIGTILLTTILKNNGVNAEILGFHDFGTLDDFDPFIENAIETIKNKHPRIVSFYTRCDTYLVTLKLAERIRAELKDIYIVFGGPQSDLSAKETMEYISSVDYICCGEGETTVYPFFSSLLKNTPNLTVPGLVYRDGDKIIKNPRPAVIEDLDTLPELDYSLFYDNRLNDGEDVYRFPVDVGRGCPFSCTFCSTKTFWNRRYRLKGAQRIVKEIKDVHEKFGVTEFSFKHDMFTMDKKRVSEVCKLLKTLDFPIKWSCSARVDCIDRELIDTMVDAGMYLLYVGVESGSPRIQEIINKRLKLDGVTDLLKYIASKGVGVTASLIFGFPEETEEDFSQTISFIKDIVDHPNIRIKVNMCTFFPGTEITTKYSHLLTRSSVLTNQTNDRAVEECSEYIEKYPSLFPQYHEYKTELREKMELFPDFFKFWKPLSPIYHYISTKYKKDRLCDMYFDFAKSNEEMLAQHFKRTIYVFKNDKFIDSFKDDEKYTLIKEIQRYLIWKMESKEEAVDIFGFDVEKLEKTYSLDGIEEKAMLVSLKRVAKDKIELSFHKF